MANEQVAIRLTSQGGDQILRTLEQIGTAAQAQFRRAADEARAFSREAANLAQAPVSRTSTQIHAEAFAGVNDNRASAASRAADIAAYGATLDALRAKYSPLYAAQRQYLSTLDEIRGAERSGALTRGEAAVALERTKSAFSAQVTTLRGVKQPLDEHTKSVGLARYEWINLGRQFQDVGVQLAGGQSPFLIMVEQGSQIADVFSSSRGGAGAALKDFGGAALRFATNPLTLLAAGLGVAAYAAYQFSEQQDALERSLNGTGRAAGVTADRLREIAVASGRPAGLSPSESLGLAGQFASGGVAGSNIKTLVGDALPFAHAFGLDLEKAGDEITQIVSESGLGAFEKRFGAVSFSTKEMIRSLEASGRYIDAQAEKTRLFDAEVKKAKDTSSELEKVWRSIRYWATTPVLGLGPSIGRLMNGPSLQEQLASARGEFFNLRAQRQGDASSYPGEAAAEARVRELEQRIQQERDKTAQAARDADLNRRSQIAGPIIDSMMPDSTRLRGLKEQLGAVEPLTKTADGLAKLGDRADEARQTVEMLAYGVTHFQTATEKMREDSALAVREITALTFAERESVAAQRAYTQVMRSDIPDAIRAAAAAESERVKMFAESARKVDDLVRTSRDSLSLSRASNPLEKRMMEIDISERDFRRENIPDAAAPMSAALNTAASAANRFADALNQATMKINGSNVAPFTPRGDISAADPRGMSSYIRDRAGAYGIDPDTALRVARSEGLRTFSGDNGTSFGAMQLHVGGGVGDEFRKSTGLDPSDPANERATIDYALKIAAQRGWGPWHGAARAGIGEWEGIGRVASNDNLSTQTARGFGDQRDAAQYEARIKPQEDFAKSIIAGNDALRARVDTLGMDQRAIDESTKRQELMNEAIRQTGTILPEQQKWIETNAAAWADYQQKVRDADRAQKHSIENRDAIRGTFTDTLGGGFKALAHGQDVGAALEKSMSSAMDRMIDTQVSRLGESLLGQTGTSEGGLLGQLFGGLGLGATQSTAQMNVQAGVVTVNGGIGAAGGSVGGGSGLIGSAVSWLGSLFGAGKNAGGTDNWRGGLSWVGENGPELLNLPRGSQVMPSVESMKMARNLDISRLLTLGAGGGAGSGRPAVGSHPQTQVSFVNAPAGNVDVREKRRSDTGVSLEVTFGKMLKKAAANGALEGVGVRRPMKSR